MKCGKELRALQTRFNRIACLVRLNRQLHFERQSRVHGRNRERFEKVASKNKLSENKIKYKS